jgi:hypothetical protein
MAVKMPTPQVLYRRLTNKTPSITMVVTLRW